jgi:hypothetical protein
MAPDIARQMFHCAAEQGRESGREFGGYAGTIKQYIGGSKVSSWVLQLEIQPQPF